MAVNKISAIKFFELLITLACLFLHYKSMAETGRETVLLLAGTYVGFTIILIALFAGYLLNTPSNKRIDIFISIIGCALFIACGVKVIDIWNDTFFKTDERTMALSKGGLSIVNGVLFLVDVFFTFRD
jgi:uncharacterized membrane protein